MNNDFIVEDSGERQVFDGGMVRDTTEGKVNFDLLWVNGINYYQQPMTRFAEHMTKGAAKYGERNFEKASGWGEFNRFIVSTGRHFNLWRCGEKKEDHLAAVMFNVLALMMMEARGYTVPTPPKPPTTPSHALGSDSSQFRDEVDKLVTDGDTPCNDEVGSSEDIISCDDLDGSEDDDLDGSEDDWVDRFISDYHGSPYMFIDDIAREAASRFVKQTIDYWADDFNGVVQSEDKL